MYSACIFCRAPLGANPLIEHFPVGRTLAFDARKGRLWAVCRGCGGWNLAPIEERWEPIEECERAFRGTRVRFSTDHIGLATHASGLELVRIGPALRPEFAAWRYGPRMRRRRQRALVAGAAGAAALGAAVIGIPLALGASFFTVSIGRTIYRTWQKGQGQRRVLDLPERGLVIRRRHLPHIRWTPSRDGRPWSLDVPLIGDDGDATEVPAGTEQVVLSGADGMRVASVALNVLNRRAGRAAELRDAVDWIGVCGSPFSGAETGSDPAFLAEREERRNALEARQRVGLYDPMNFGESLADMPAYQRLAFELAANEDQERLFLTTHLWLLERHWREAEEVAAIADGMLVPEKVEEQLRRMKG
jgi:hypothetical protein